MALFASSMVAVLTFVFATPAHATPSISASTVSTSIGTTNVTPVWGPQINKVVYDNGWYYAVAMNGSGTSYPWNADLWESPDGVNWTLAVTIGAWVYQPPGLIEDSGNRLWLDIPCYTGGTCYPGANTLSGSAQQYVYLQRLQFSTFLANGSIDFSNFAQHSVLTTTAQRYYRGAAIDHDRRYMYEAYSDTAWNFKLSTYDTWNNTETTQLMATPGSGTNPQQAYLYPRVRPGTSSGEIWLLFDQDYVGQQSTSIFGVQLWHSTNGGATWSEYMVAECLNPDANNFCDAVDLVVDSNDAPHVLYYKAIAGVNHLYYWAGSPGNVTLPGSPTDLGAYNNHSQMSFTGTAPVRIFAFTGPDNNLDVLSSSNGTTWTSDTKAVPGAGVIYTPTLMRPESGSFHSEDSGIYKMLLSSTATGTTSPFSQLQFVTYTA
jgi:hypothetical protein